MGRGSYQIWLGGTSNLLTLEPFADKVKGARQETFRTRLYAAQGG